MKKKAVFNENVSRKGMQNPKFKKKYKAASLCKIALLAKQIFAILLENKLNRLTGIGTKNLNETLLLPPLWLHLYGEHDTKMAAKDSNLCRSLIELREGTQSENRSATCQPIIFALLFSLFLCSRCHLKEK